MWNRLRVSRGCSDIKRARQMLMAGSVTNMFGSSASKSLEYALWDPNVAIGLEIPQMVGHKWVRGCVGAWVRGCVGAWVRGCVGA
jgi:hypothetical protein